MSNQNTTKPIKTQRKAKISTDIPVEIELHGKTPNNGRITLRSTSEDCPQFGPKKDDVCVIDGVIQPVIGEPAIYEKGKKNGFFMLNYHQKKRRGYKYLGMITHVLRCVYKPTDEILNAEFLIESEVPQ